MRTEFPDPDDTLNFTLTIDPDEGMYKGGRFHFTFAIPQSFPHEAPKVKCTQKIYHPNIDLEGNVCLNILREDWKPVLNLQAVIVGLQVRVMSWEFWQRSFLFVFLLLGRERERECVCVCVFMCGYEIETC
jgi:ubiquitin-protein ligase